MDYFSRKSLSKYLMNTIEFNKHDVDIFINGTWQKYAGNIGGGAIRHCAREMLIKTTFNQANF
jgi:hypothetical protein